MILIVSAVFPPEPVVSAILSYDLAETLANENCAVTVLCPLPTRPKGFSFEKSTDDVRKFKIIRLCSYTCSASNIIGRMLESYSFGKHCALFIKANSSKFDCIYINSWPLLSQYFIVRTAKKLNIASVIHVQDIYPESLLNKVSIGKSLLYKLLLPIDKYILKNSTSIIAISENMKNTLVNTRFIHPEKVTVVANWQNENDFISFRNSKSIMNERHTGSFTFMYLGNNGPLAGVEFLIYSFVKANIPNSKLVIAGSGSNTKTCIELANSLNAKNIEFIQVPVGKVPMVQDKADVLLLPVMKNGAMSSIPSKLPAYMFSAKPIIGSLDMESDTARAINDSDCGIVVEPENEDELIDAMRRASQWGIVLREKKGNAGFSYAISNFSRKSNLEKVVSIIQNVL